MNLPDKFQMRHVDHKGFTNVVVKTEEGFKVKWARGYAEHLGQVPCGEFSQALGEQAVRMGHWIVVDETKKAPAKYPDNFVAYAGYGHIKWAMRKDGDFWYAHNLNDNLRTNETKYSEEYIDSYVQKGTWKIIKADPLTPEQRKANAELREQIAALENSIRLNRQDIAHKEILIANYQARSSELLSKIVEGV